MIRVKKNFFDGSGKVFERNGGLADIIRAFAVELACNTVFDLAESDFTDSSTGTAGASFVGFSLAPDGIDTSGGSGCPNTAFNTALGVIANANAVCAEHINAARARLGLTAITYADGTVATPGTIPAMTKTVTASTGTNSISIATYQLAVARMSDNQGILADALREMQVALGLTPTASTLPTRAARDYSMAAALTGTAVASAALPAGSKAVADVFLTAAAANVATFAAKFALLLDEADPANRASLVLAV